ncbi:MAG: aspartate carbamoyltransferase [Actinomycetota bacterium]|nr:aspartate carbamoyltransferase [Actinomycetota bacterium]
MPSPDPTATNLATPTPGRRRRRIALGFGAAALTAALITAALIAGGNDAQQSRQDEVADRGASVMPFDLELTEHIFTDLPDGGEQTVTALDAADTTQILLIRGHLQEEAAKFRSGDFEDPAAIHGEDMPGLAELRDGALNGRIAVTYTELEDGARLRYTSTDPDLVDGIHSWFAAQTMDHG